MGVTVRVRRRGQTHSGRRGGEGGAALAPKKRGPGDREAQVLKQAQRRRSEVTVGRRSEMEEEGWRRNKGVLQWEKVWFRAV